MSEFLVVLKKVVVDQPFKAAVPEVLDPDDGVTVLVPAVPEQPLITHLEYDRSWVESNPATVAENLENGLTPNQDYYLIQTNGAQLQATLHPVSLKAGPRAPAPAREIVEIEANGQDAGSAIMEV